MKSIQVRPIYRDRFSRIALKAEPKGGGFLSSAEAQMFLGLSVHEVPLFVGNERFDQEKHVNWKNLYQWRSRQKDIQQA